MSKFMRIVMSGEDVEGRAEVGVVSGRQNALQLFLHGNWV